MIDNDADDDWLYDHRNPCMTDYGDDNNAADYDDDDDWSYHDDDYGNKELTSNLLGIKIILTNAIIKFFKQLIIDHCFVDQLLLFNQQTRYSFHVVPLLW